MRLPLRIALLPLVILLGLPTPAPAQEEGDPPPPKITEADYATYRKLEDARALAESRSVFDARNAAKHRADVERAFKAAGWTEQRFDEVGAELSSVGGTLYDAREGSLAPEDVKEMLAGHDPVTIATARAHAEEIVRGTDASQRADEQVRRELSDAAAGKPPTAAQLAGTWVPDVEATFRGMLGDLAEGPMMTEGKKQLEKDLAGTSYVFGPGDVIVSTAAGADGKLQVSRGTFRLDGHRIWFRAGGSKREYKLDAGLRDGRLVLGLGMTSVVYRRK